MAPPPGSMTSSSLYDGGRDGGVTNRVMLGGEEEVGLSLTEEDWSEEMMYRKGLGVVPSTGPVGARPSGGVCGE